MKSRNLLIAVGALMAGMVCYMTARSATGRSETLSIIPRPEKLQATRGSFTLRPSTRILVDAEGRTTGEYLAERLHNPTGYSLKIEDCPDADAPKGNILLTTKNAKPELGSEGYQLVVSPSSVTIRATGSAGLFYGVQTFLQLFPAQIFSPETVPDQDWKAACVRVEDQPRFQWRGFMLDVSRHFYNKSEIMQVLDTLALHKLNTFHWHLVDDQGWRIEIKKYPRLTEVGAWRKGIGFKLDPKSSTAYGPDGRYGGFYTQDDIREIVVYAQARHITIVPEIEMPGHSSAALAAYPEYSCSGGSYTTDMNGGIFAGVYCAGNDQTFEFLQNILTEVMGLFPGKYIHIGGDEVNKDNWHKCEKCQARMQAEGLKSEHELQSYFIRRIEKFIDSHGRTLIGWSEIREGGLAQNAAIMDWIGGGVESAKDGHDVVMSPTKYCYLDHYQSTNHATEPHAIGGFLPLEHVYAFEPVPTDLPAQYQSHILGAQGNLWTEYVASFKHVQYMSFPRLCALSEVTWSPQAGHNYEDFLKRLEVQCQRFDLAGINYRKLTPRNGG